MDDSDAGGNQTDARRPGAADDESISVVYVDPDSEARERLVTFVRGGDDIAVETARDAPEGRKLVERLQPDAVVVESDVPVDGDDALLTGPRPTVLFTDEDPVTIADTTLERADSLVEKGATGSQRLLIEKLRGIVHSREESDITWEQTVEILDGNFSDEIGLFLVDEQGLVLWSSVPFETMFPAESVDATLPETDDFYARFGVLLSDHPQTLRDMLDQKHTEGTNEGRLIELPGQDGREWYLYTSYPVGEELTGQRIEVFFPVTTVFDRYERLGLFENLVDNAEDGLYVLDANGQIEYCNRSYAAMLGYEREELLGEHVSIIMAEGEIEAGQEVVSEALEGDGTSNIIDMALRHRDGSEVHVSINGSILRDSTGSYAGLMGVIRDITERKKRERELEQYRNLVESASDPMYVLDEDGTIQILNAAMAEFVGREKESLVGADVRTILPEEGIERGRASLEEILSTDGPESDSFEIWLIDADGENRLFEVTATALTADEEFAGSVATYRDITERHRRQEELDLRKQIFARSLRHNIRNETSVIRSYGSILADELDGEHGEMAKDILEASRSLARTSEKVSQFDWLVEQDPEQATHHLAQLVARCLEEVRGTNPDTIVEVDVDSDIAVRGIRDLDIAVYNLIENALQHGTADSAATVTIEATASPDTVCLSIVDDGPGIPRTEVEVIQGGEETALKHASGLGLWLVRRIVDQSNGTLSFEVDDGTVVQVRLPRAEPAEP